jgi:DNA mismatch repair protein MutS2
MTVATTHYTELKALAHATDGMQNAALDVDPVTMAPTYHLTVGIPGGSNALATASRLGLPAEIVTRAQHMLSQGAQEIEALLTHLVTEQKNLESLRHSLEKELNEAEQSDADLKNRLRQLEEERRKIIKETRDQIVREAAELQMKIREAATELRKEKSRERIEQAKKALAEAQEQLDAGVWQARPAVEIEETEAEAGPITAGDTVWLKEAGVPATVLSVSEERGLVEVQAGKVKMTLKLDSVEKRIPSTGAVKTAGALITRRLSKSRVHLELDLRGKRAEEVEPALEDYLNEASLCGLSRVRIIHGIGTGTVRQIVREILASHPLVTSFQPGEQGEGGDGVTIVSM